MHNPSGFTRFASFEIDGAASYGTVEDAGIRRVPPALQQKLPSLRDAIAENALALVTSSSGELVPFAACRLLPPIPDPRKIICIGRNYAAHAAESGQKPPAHPSFFTKFTDTLVAHGGAVTLPRLSPQFDFEGELAVVIGRGGRHIATGDALRHVAGYSCFMDGSVRDMQFQHSLAAGKNFPATAGFGPWLAVPDHEADPAGLHVRTRLNGVEVQSAGVDEMIFSVADLIAFVSGITPLAPGDILATGTPEGVGFARQPPLWLQEGDTVEVDCGPVGCLRLTVSPEA